MEELREALEQIRAMAADGLLDAAEAQQLKREAMAAHRERERFGQEAQRDDATARRAGALAMSNALAQAASQGLALPSGYTAPAEAPRLTLHMNMFNGQLPHSLDSRNGIHTGGPMPLARQREEASSPSHAIAASRPVLPAPAPPPLPLPLRAALPAVARLAAPAVRAPAVPVPARTGGSGSCSEEPAAITPGGGVAAAGPTASAALSSRSTPSDTAAVSRHLAILSCRLCLPADATLSAQHRHALAQQLHLLVDDAAKAVQGYVAQRKADGCDVYLGYPTPIAQPVEGACAVALALLGALPRLRGFVQRQAGVGLPAMCMRLAVHSDTTVVGGIGGGEAHASGEIVEVVAQLLALAGPNEVALSGGTTRDAASQRFDTAPLAGAKPVSVGAELLPVYRLLGEKQLLERQGRALFGRGSEKRLLLSLADKAVGGCGQACLLTAGAGLGKTALILHVAERLKSESKARVLVAHSSQVHGSSLHSVKQFLRRWQLPSDPTAAVTVQRAMGDAFGGAGQEAHATALRAALGDGMASLADQTKAFVEWLAALAARRALVLVIEDCEWIDKASGDVIGALLEQRLAQLPLFVVLGIRSEDGVRDERMRGWLAREDVTHLELGPLLAAEARELVQANAPSGDLPAELVEYILQTSDCKPLDLEQVGASAVPRALRNETQHLARGRSCHTHTASCRAMELCATGLSMTRERCERADD